LSIKKHQEKRDYREKQQRYEYKNRTYPTAAGSLTKISAALILATREVLIIKAGMGVVLTQFWGKAYFT
jgi:hypothetical protein